MSRAALLIGAALGTALLVGGCSASDPQTTERLRTAIAKSGGQSVDEVRACLDPSDDERERQALLATDAAFARASAERGVEGWLSFVEPDATVHSSGQSWAGTQSLRELMSRELDGVSWSPERAVVSASSDLGYTSGSWRVQSSDGTIVEAGTYVTVWRKQADGTWKVSVDISQS